MKKYRKKPLVIEAVQWDGDYHLGRQLQYDNRDSSTRLVMCPGAKGEGDMQMLIQTLDGNMYANNGDYIIKGIKGELYPCKSDIFEETYEEVND